MVEMTSTTPAEEPDVNVTLLALRDEDGPDGKTLTPRLIVPANPLALFTMIVGLAEDPAAILKPFVLAAKVNPFTLTPTRTKWVNGPKDPVTFTV